MYEADVWAFLAEKSTERLVEPTVDNDDIAVSNFMRLAGTTVDLMRFRKRPTAGSTSSGLMMMSSSLNVTLRFRFDLLALFCYFWADN